MRVQLVMTLPAEAASVPTARHTLTTALICAGVNRDCVDEMEVAVSEACTNVIQHVDAVDAYEVVINLTDQQLSIDVLDSGHGFGEPTRPPTMAETNAESGRGMGLMRALADRAVFDSVSGHGGGVHLTKNLRWTDQPDAQPVSETTTEAIGGAEGDAPAPPTGP